MRIIPAIDIINGKCVRLRKGDYNTSMEYNENPLEVAKEFEDNGIGFLHLVDLDGARTNGIVNHKVLNRIASQTKLKIDFGGGLKSTKDVEIAFDNGASQITGGSVALHKPELFLEWLETYGSQKIILGADALDGKIATQGWLHNSEREVIEFIIDFEAKGIRNVVCTDIDKDGMLEGPSIELYERIIETSTINLIASGGISSLSDLKLLKHLGCEAAIIGKALYEKKISLNELQELC